MEERGSLWMVGNLQLVKWHVPCTYCYIYHLFIDIFAEECNFSTGAVAGITFTITLLVALPVGVVIGLGVSWWVRRRCQGPTGEGPQQKTEQQLQGAIYEEPVETVIPLSDNLAYGHVDLKRKN